jgi:hypothetical protein
MAAAELGTGAATTIAGALLANSANNAATIRQQAGQSSTEVLLGTAADLTGLTSFVMGIHGKDIATGERVELSAFERGKHIGLGATQFLMTLTGTYKAADGAIRQSQKTVDLGKLLSWFRGGPPPATAAVSVGRGISAAAAPRNIAIPIPRPDTRVFLQTAVVELAGTPIVIHMTANGPGKWEEVARRDGPSLERQSLETGNPIRRSGGQAFIREYKLGNKFFDSFRATAKQLLDVKDDYDHLFSQDWFRNDPTKVAKLSSELQDEVFKQLAVADAFGMQLVWRVRSSHLQSFKDALGQSLADRLIWETFTP